MAIVNYFSTLIEKIAFQSSMQFFNFYEGVRKALTVFSKIISLDLECFNQHMQHYFMTESIFYG